MSLSGYPVEQMLAEASRRAAPLLEQLRDAYVSLGEAIRRDFAQVMADIDAVLGPWWHRRLTDPFWYVPVTSRVQHQRRLRGIPAKMKRRRRGG